GRLGNERLKKRLQAGDRLLMKELGFAAQQTWEGDKHRRMRTSSLDPREAARLAWLGMRLRERCGAAIPHSRARCAYERLERLSANLLIPPYRPACPYIYESWGKTKLPRAAENTLYSTCGERVLTSWLRPARTLLTIWEGRFGGLWGDEKRQTTRLTHGRRW